MPNLLLVCVLTTGGRSGDGAPPDGSGPVAPAPPEAADTRLWIGPELVDCTGVGPQKCMLVRHGPYGEWEYFYSGIEEFTHVEGTSYVIDVVVTEIEDPPADGSSLHYRLVEVLESQWWGDLRSREEPQAGRGAAQG